MKVALNKQKDTTLLDVGTQTPTRCQSSLDIFKIERNHNKYISSFFFFGNEMNQFKVPIVCNNIIIVVSNFSMIQQ